MPKRGYIEQRKVSQRLDSRYPHSIGEGKEGPTENTEKVVVSQKPGYGTT